MFRLWGRLVYDGNYTAKDLVICDDTKETRTHKIFRGLNSICDAWNLAVPIWLDSNITDFKRHSKTRFRQDNWIEEIDFDFLEIQVIEEKEDIPNLISGLEYPLFDYSDFDAPILIALRLPHQIFPISSLCFPSRRNTGIFSIGASIS